MEENKIINSYDNLSVGKYQELMEVIGDKEADQYDKNLSIVSILTGIDEMELYEMPINRFNHLLQNSSFLLEGPKKASIQEKYTVGKYTLIPQFSLGDMTTAQFIDYQTFVKDVEKNLCQLLAVFLIPKGHKYNDGYDLADVVNEIKDNLCVCDAVALSAFFLILFKGLLKGILTSFKQQMKKMQRKKTVPKEQMKVIQEKMVRLEQIGDGLL